MINGKEKKFVFDTVERNGAAIACLCDNIFWRRLKRHFKWKSATSSTNRYCRLIKNRRWSLITI